MKKFMEFKALASKDIYPFPITSDLEKLGKWIVYLPLIRYATIVDKDVVVELQNAICGRPYGKTQIVEDILSHMEDEKKKIYYTSSDETGLLNMMILPNNKCNFHCSYCYSAYGRSGKEISYDKLSSAIDYFFDISRAANQRLTISVLGGGEPLLSWDLLKRALNHAFELGVKRKTKIPVSLVTNGSLIPEDMLEYCKENDISVSESFDILEDIQREQRGSYELVKDNINRISDYGLDVALNTVITNSNVDRMKEMILHMDKEMPLVKKVSFKSLISNSYFSDMQAREDYYRKFVDHFFEAKDLAQKKGIYLVCPYWNAVICLADRYCPGKFVVTAEGTISICHCVSSEKDLLYDKFIYGRISEGHVDVNREKLQAILAFNQNKFDSCQTCPCRWHCAGGCYTDNCTMSEIEKETYCVSMRYFLEKFLLKYVIQ